MTAKRRKRNTGRKSRRAALTPAELEVRAIQDLEAHRYREAINRFKELLKTQARPEWQAGLAAAYAGRAEELAAKGMQKEALAIWQNREQLCPAAAPVPDHLLLLLRLGQGSEAVSRYQAAAERLDPAGLAELRSHFAALYLSDAPELHSGLPADDPVIIHGTAARAALAAYCQNDDAAVTQALAQIPFRSPYRDWVQILKALLQLPNDVSAAEKLLQRMPANSPFSSLREAVRLAMLPELEFLAELPKVGESTQQFAAVLRGWPAQRLALWREMRKLGDSVRARVWLAFLYRHRDRLGDQWVEQRGLRLLRSNFPDSLHWPVELGGRRLSPWEQGLVESWQAEESEDPWQVLDAWTRVTWNLRQPAEPPPGSDDALRIALIQRRLDTRWHLLNFPADDYYSEQISQKTLAQLEESLDLDPDDQPTYLRLISHYRAQDRLKDARRLLEPALNRWPQDAAVLEEALETAVAGNAFRKAATFAHRILARDPINSRARTSLLEARLAHARKQLRTGRGDLAQKELKAAEEWTQGEKASCKLELLHGFLTLQQDRAAGATALCAATERLGGGLIARLDLAIEAYRLSQALGPLMKHLGLPKLRSPENKADLLAVLHRLREFMDGGEEIPLEILDFFAPVLKAGSKFELTRQESESACETFRRCELYSSRLAYARAALKHWPGLPVFELHAFEAKYKGYYYHASQADIQRVQGALEKARASGDMRTAHRIQEMMHRLPFMPFAPFALPPEPDEPDDEFLDVVDGLDIEALLNMLDHSGELRRELKEIEQFFGRERMLEMLQDMVDAGPPDIDEDFPIEPPRPKSPRKRQKTGASTPSKPGKKASEQDSPASERPDKPDQPDLFK